MYMYRSVPQICPPFATLALVQNAGGGLYAGCNNFYDYALPSGHEVIVGGGGDQVLGVAEREGERWSRC